MSMRLQILVDEEEAAEFRRSATREGITFSDWARRAMRDYTRRRPGRSCEQKLQALERALEHSHPTADIEEMLRQIEGGRDLR